MKRLQFLKNLAKISSVTIVAPSLLASETILESKNDNKYKFDEVFYRIDTNKRIIYPKVDSIFYSKIYNLVKDRVSDSIPTYLPVYELSIPIKEEYTEDELKPILFYFENTYYRYDKFSMSRDVIFRMIENTPGRMRLEVFLNYRY